MAEIWGIITTLVTLAVIALGSLEFGYWLGQQDKKEQAHHGQQ